ncbi:MAG: hypothetical protein HUJ68_06545 [Clostridia bacterium]|nr:hypothetical protein [Clostridia bacterium]
MKSEKEKNSGITLISLIVAVIVLLILTSIGTTSGIEVVKHSKFVKFQTELKIMQVYVNELYEKWKIETNRDENSEILQIGEELTHEDRMFLQERGISDENINDYRKYTQQETIQSQEIEGVEGEFFVNIKNRSIISCKGLEYNGTTYYSMDQIPNGLYNVEYVEKENTITGEEIP